MYSYTVRMRRSFVAFAFAGVTAAFGLADARADAPAQASHGALVIALGNDVTPATKALAREVYRNERLQPAVDEATVRVLAGEPIAQDAPEALQSLARVRASLPTTPDDLGAKLLTAIGQERHVEFVVAVSMTADRPTARVVRVDRAKYESVLLEATTERQEGDVVKHSWPGATSVLLQLFVPPTQATQTTPNATGAITPRKVEAPAKQPPDKRSSWYKSPWFWGPLGAVVATGAAILITTQVTKDNVDTVHLRGQVGP